jgi:hypothetical protein
MNDTVITAALPAMPICCINPGAAAAAGEVARGDLELRLIVLVVYGGSCSGREEVVEKVINEWFGF